MVFDLIRLKSNLEKSISIDCDYKIDEPFINSTEIMNPFCIHVNGFITKSTLEGFDIQIQVDGVMELPCSITLKPVSVPFSIEIEGNLDELLEEIEENHKKIENSIDLLPIIWENILMEIPMKVTSPDAYSTKVEGNGWKFVTEEEEEINPALAKLKDLL